MGRGRRTRAQGVTGTEGQEFWVKSFQTQAKAWKDPQDLHLDVHWGPGQGRTCARRGRGSGLPSQHLWVDDEVEEEFSLWWEPLKRPCEKLGRVKRVGVLI